MRGKKKASKGGKTKGQSKSYKISRFLPIFLIFSLSLLTFFAYIRSLNGPLVFDDYIFIEPVRLNSFPERPLFHSRFIAEMSFYLNYYLSGFNVAFFKLTNVILHIISSALVFYLTHITVNSPNMTYKDRQNENRVSNLFLPFTVAALFSLHPIQTSSVNYITQRMAIMAAMFSFTGLILYAKGAVSSGWKSFGYYALSAFAFFLAVFSKENAVMVFLIIPIYDLVFISSFRWKELRNRLIPLTLLALILLLTVSYKMPILDIFKQFITIYLNPHEPLGSYAWGGIDIQWTPIEYLLTELRIVSRYIFLILFPSPSFMVFDYSNAYPVSKSLFSPVSTFFSLLFLVSLLFLSTRYIKKFPLACFGILWYLITISLESFIAIGLDPYFEHRNYLPSFGLFLCLSSFLEYAAKIRIKREVIISVGVVLLFILTFIRNGVWSKDEFLWRDALNKSPGNSRAIISLSGIYIREGRYRDAQECINKATKTHPIDSSYKYDMLFNQAGIHRVTGRKQEAMAIYNELLSWEGLSDKKRATLYHLIGEVLGETGRFSEAKEYLETAYGLSPDNPFLYTALGIVSRSLGEVKEAETYFKGAIEKEPNQVIPYVELGDIYFERSDRESAEKYYEGAISKGFTIPRGKARNVFFNLAQIKMLKGKIDDSIVLFAKVTDIDPLFYPPFIFLGNIFLKKGDINASLFYLEKAASLKDTFVKDDPNAKLLYFNLGMAYIMKGDKKLARKNLSFFLSLAHGDRRLEEQTRKAEEKLALIRD